MMVAKPTLADLKHGSPDPCPLCGRPNHHPSDHHLVPRSRESHAQDRGELGSPPPKLPACRDCHDAIHATFSNKQLEREYNTVDALMAHEGFAKMIAFIGKQNGRVHFKLAKSQRRRGRNG